MRDEYYTITMSLRKDEREAVAKIMSAYDMKRHEVVKYALRRFLFPDENVVPINGKVAEPYPPYAGRMRVKDEGITVWNSLEDMEKHRLAEQKARAESLKKVHAEHRKALASKLSEKDRKELESYGVTFE